MEGASRLRSPLEPERRVSRPRRPRPDCGYLINTAITQSPRKTGRGNTRPFGHGGAVIPDTMDTFPALLPSVHAKLQFKLNKLGAKHRRITLGERGNGRNISAIGVRVTSERSGRTASGQNWAARSRYRSRPTGAAPRPGRARRR